MAPPPTPYAAVPHRITVLIPAHNEQATIGRAIESVRRQTRAVDEIVVIADNCTDGTAEIAAGQGARVVATVGNAHKKAGALNQVLDGLLDAVGERDKIMVMDADSFLDPHFVEVAEEWLDRGDGRVYGGIGGTFRGREGEHPRRGGLAGVADRWVEAAQANEYARYARDVRRKDGDVLVLTGTATLFNVAALRDVVAQRAEGRIPSRGGTKVYDTEVLTEDNELTFALRHIGWKVRSPNGCTLTTEVMPTWSRLYRQRLRWKRGAMENLRQYGLTRHTAKHWGYQILGFLGIAVMCLYFASLAWSLTTGGPHIYPLWIVVTAVFAVERIVTVRRRGWRSMLLASVLLVEMCYDIFLQVTHIKALADAATGRAANW
jgi:cellulose synthase/poly-beta-1,6-N-acetylglucosamine synthase-like glycosyltransferase